MIRCVRVNVRMTNKTIHALNMGSYNYLGFAQNSGECADQAERAVHDRGLGVCSSRHEIGTSPRPLTDG